MCKYVNITYNIIILLNVLLMPISILYSEHWALKVAKTYRVLTERTGT